MGRSALHPRRARRDAGVVAPVAKSSSRRVRSAGTATAAATAQRLIASLGGRYSQELGIRLEPDDAAVDEWFLASTLFGTRISAELAMRTYRELARAGVRTVADTRTRTWDELVALLDAGGYARYDFRTATRLQQLAGDVHDRLAGTVTTLAVVDDPRRLESELDRLPGWGPTTVRIFLRELRGVWPGAQPAIDDRTARAARHLGLTLPRGHAAQIDALHAIAARAHVDVRDLESGLVRLALTHRDQRGCKGGAACRALEPT